MGHPVPYLFRDVQGLLLASAQNTEYKAPSSFKSHAIDRLLSFCWWKSLLKVLGLPTRGSNPRPPVQQAGYLSHYNNQLPWSAQGVWPSFVASRHCLVSFWRQTSINISRDFGAMWYECVVQSTYADCIIGKIAFVCVTAFPDKCFILIWWQWNWIV